MENATLALFVHELRNQCMYTEASFRVFNQSLEQRSSTGVFFAAQATLLCASQLSSVLWPTKARARKRGEKIREVLQLPEKHPLSDKRLATAFDYGDEKFDDWVGTTKGRQVVFDHLGPIEPFLKAGVQEECIYRLYDPSTMTLYFRGEGFNMQAIANAISDIYTRLTALHMQMFPDQHKPEETDAEQAPAEDAAKKEKPKKAATKKPAAKKPAAKKAPAKKPAAKKKAAAK